MSARHLKPRKPVGALRPCMTCGAMFISAGKHNRMCDDCRVSSQDTSPFEPMFEWGDRLSGPQRLAQIREENEGRSYQ
jgi:hypothetical protein